MKSNKIVLSLLFCGMAVGAWAQKIPQHDKYVSYFNDGNSKSFTEYFPNWKPGTPLSEDENFFISRVKRKERFDNQHTQVNPALTPKRQFCLWTPMGISDTYWQSLPRYVMDGDNFSMWSYVDYQGAWSASWIRVPGAYLDVTHKNGVRNGGGVIFFSGNNNAEPQACINMLVEKENGNFKYAKKLAQYLRYYGIDGIGVNPEAYVANAQDFQDFVIECRKEARAIDWDFTLYWYDACDNNGNYKGGGVLSEVANKDDWFVKNGQPVADMYMLDYGFSYNTSAQTSSARAEMLGGNPYSLFGGYNLQGQWIFSGRWSVFENTPLSILFWGDHNTNMLYLASTDYGASDEAVQAAYLVKQEQMFSGGNRNPFDRPEKLKDNAQSLADPSESAMKKWQGLAEYMTARSVLQELPFITRFGLGNGKVFRKEGQVTFDKKWFNIATQDYLPTWRWWITDNSDGKISDPVNCTFTFDDSWFAGSCLKLSGKTAASKIRMFKTNFTLSANDNISLRYKVNNGDTKSHLKLIWSKVGSESTFESCDIPDASVSGEWAEAKFTASQIKMDGQVACIGFLVENTSSDYEVLLGELAIVNGKSYSPAKPTIITDKNNILLKRTYSSLDFKFSWKSAEPDADDPSKPIYNEDVDTWYFEVYCQPNGGEKTLCGTTTSWAHYVVGAPVSADPNVSEYRVGVCAVAPDGETVSDIAWSDWLTMPVTSVDGIQCDKAVIKSGEKFTLSLIDPNQPEPISWELKNSSTGVSAGSQAGGSSFTISLDKEGYYDVELTKDDDDFTKLIYRGYVQISPESTGSLPRIDDILVDRTEVDVTKDEVVKLSYQGHDGEGTVSRGLRIEDPYQLYIPDAAMPDSWSAYSIGFWVKPEKFSHDKFGTNLINKRGVRVTWPNGNWGAFWVHIWPQTKDANDKVILDDNTISYTLYKSTGSSFNGNSNIHEVPNIKCCTDGAHNNQDSYSLSLGQWTHVMITFGNREQKIYFNGRCVATNSVMYTSSYNGDNMYGAPILIGGVNKYHAGLNGVIDDLQIYNKVLSADEVIAAMAGFEGKSYPANLKSYYTFEQNTYNASTQEFSDLVGTHKAYYAALDNASGETNTNATFRKVDADINVEGNPALPGSLNITTTSSFSIVGAQVNNSGKTATATFDTNGIYSVTCTLKNGWGETSVTKPRCITVVGGLTDIDGSVVENLTVYPNPFIDEVTLQFASEGSYHIDLFDASGRTVTTKEVTARAGEITTLSVNGGKGMYYVAVSKEGKRLQTLKLIAQ